MHPVQQCARLLIQKGKTLATVESCTGGLLAHMLTNIPGSSSYFMQGWIVYSNLAKQKQLDIPSSLIKRYGPVSAHVAHSLAKNGHKKAKTDFVIAITGIAGPTGGTSKKPVGTVYIAVCTPEGEILVHKSHFKGTRLQIKRQSVEKALRLLHKELLKL